MDRRIIIVIIVLMSFALLGSFSLQYYWISNAIKLNEEQLDKNVFATLRHIANLIEKEESDKISKISAFVQRNTPKEQAISAEEFMQMGLDPERVMAFDSSYHNAREIPNPTGSPALNRRTHNMLETMLSQQLFGLMPIEERIDAQKLQNFILQEFKKAGLGNLQFQSGVYSTANKDFVIKNGHYVINGTTPTPDAVQVQAFDYLSNTPYKVELFKTPSGEVPGDLALYFNKASYVWLLVWKVVVASICFSIITLFCFAYVTIVIFRQKKIDEIKNDFINNMTHEFKTPLATISLAADSIGSPMILNNPEKVKRFVDIIKQENKRMNGQVEKVLQMAIIDRDKFKLKITDIDIHEIIMHAAANFSIQIEQRDGVLKTDLAAQNAIIEGDFTHISNIIHNLMDNANKYSPEKPEITVKTRNISGGIEITVQDKGLGLSPSSRKLIFDKFYRVPTGNVHDVKGFGLGLSYVKTMLTAHRGTIDVKSELGKGSSFIIYLPFKQNYKE